MSESPAPPVKQAQRPHPLTPLAKGWISLVAIVVVFGQDGVRQLSRHPDLRSVGIVAGLIGILLVLSLGRGFFTWRTTRFVIDDDELRIEHRFIHHTSDRIQFSKIQGVDVVQPFAARLMGLAALHVDVGAGAAKRIEFLSRSQSYALRDYLIARAHGDRISVDASASLPQADAWHDRAATDEVIVAARPGNLVLSSIASTGFLVATAWALTALVIGAWRGSPVAGLGAAFPAGATMVSIVSHQTIRHWHFTLTRTRKGLRVAHGVTTLTSASVPIDRIQGVIITQSPLWRPFGIYKVAMDVLGRSFASEHDEESAGGGVLVPAGSWDDVRAALAAIWPGADPDRLSWTPVDRRGRWLHPLGFGLQRWHVDATFAATRRGVFAPSITVIPHARVQSVAIRQGPLRRRLGLATVELHSSPGVVAWRRHYLTEPVARRLALSELDRGRLARRQEGELARVRSMPPPPLPAPAERWWPAPASLTDQ
ncbi:MAG: PH domain-containing protein [Propionibacterium sp.]|nr:PH domain-containing protein [Propionibacterium sp.]